MISWIVARVECGTRRTSRAVSMDVFLSMTGRLIAVASVVAISVSLIAVGRFYALHVRLHLGESIIRGRAEPHQRHANHGGLVGRLVG